MKKAVIDLGTNTFNLMIGEVVDGNLRVLETRKIPVMLGMGGINEGIIADDAWDRGIDCLSDFLEYCLSQNVTSIYGVGTSAIRGASNGADFVHTVKDYLGLEIKVISGIEESHLIYNGVKWLHDFDKPGVIMDIGGGSTEFVSADKNGIQATGSFDIGVSRIFQLLDRVEHFSSIEYGHIQEFLNERCSEFFDKLTLDELIGASGSFETYYEMIHKKKFDQGDRMVELPMDALMEQINWSLKATYQERLDNEWIVPMRKSMLPIAAFKIKWVIEKLNIEKVLLSPYSLKEGAFLEQ